MNWLHQILTGSDNQTVAFGRAVGLVLLVLGVLTPVAELVTVLYKKIPVDEWGQMLSQWQVYVPIIVAAAGGVIAGTAFTEPKAKE